MEGADLADTKALTGSNLDLQRRDAFDNLSGALEKVSVKGILELKDVASVSRDVEDVACCLISLLAEIDETIEVDASGRVPVKSWKQAQLAFAKPGYFINSLRRFPYAVDAGRVRERNVSDARPYLAAVPRAPETDLRAIEHLHRWCTAATQYWNCKQALKAEPVALATSERRTVPVARAPPGASTAAPTASAAPAAVQPPAAVKPRAPAASAAATAPATKAKRAGSPTQPGQGLDPRTQAKGAAKAGGPAPAAAAVRKTPVAKTKPIFAPPSRPKSGDSGAPATRFAPRAAPVARTDSGLAHLRAKNTKPDADRMGRPGMPGRKTVTDMMEKGAGANRSRAPQKGLSGGLARQAGSAARRIEAARSQSPINTQAYRAMYPRATVSQSPLRDRGTIMRRAEVAVDEITRAKQWRQALKDAKKEVRELRGLESQVNWEMLRAEKKGIAEAERAEEEETRTMRQQDKQAMQNYEADRLRQQRTEDLQHSIESTLWKRERKAKEKEAELEGNRVEYEDATEKSRWQDEIRHAVEDEKRQMIEDHFDGWEHTRIYREIEKVRLREEDEDEREWGRQQEYGEATSILQREKDELLRSLKFSRDCHTHLRVNAKTRMTRRTPSIIG